MNDEISAASVGIRLSSDGSVLALDWITDEGKITSFVPVDTVPTLIGMLLGAVESAAMRQPKRDPDRPALHRLFTPTDMQLLKPDDGADPVLRVWLGAVHLDFALTREHAEALQRAVLTYHRGKPRPTRPDA